MLKKQKSQDDEETPRVRKEEILDQAPSEYEAVVAIAKEARRLNAAPEAYLEEGEKAIPRAVKNFVDGKVEYEIDEDGSSGKKPRKRSRKRK
jgi:DNA-directed RNA polymerase subunit K/omega